MTPIKVEQVDREAAANLWLTKGGGAKFAWLANEMQRGEADTAEQVQAFARHRLAAEAKAFEEAARIANQFAAAARGAGSGPHPADYAHTIATAIQSRIPEIKS